MTHKITRFIFALVPVLLTGACAMQNQSFVSNEPLTVNHETVTHDTSSTNVSRAVLDTLADDIKRRGTDKVTITVHYILKKPYKESQRIAEVQGARVKTYLQQQKVRHPILVLVEPDLESGVNNINISYEALKANGPKNCLDITHADAEAYSHEGDSGYYYGCTGDTYLSQMIARPGDLLGNDTSSNVDSVRISKSQELYRTGERATDKADEGISASNVYSNQ